MQLNFMVNKNLLIWNILYQASISEEIHFLKQKLWLNHKKEYSLLYNEKASILEDLEDYIPNDDLIYNLVEENPDYKKLKQETNRYRLLLLETWDMNRKKYVKELNDILRINLNRKYNILVLPPIFNIVEINDNNIVIGKRMSLKDKDNFITYIIYKVVKEAFEHIKTDERDIVSAVLELAITNELYTRFTEKSQYTLGKKSLSEIKQKIYPYWLMYLKIKKEDMEKYMVRDNIFFDVHSYTYERNLSSDDIYDFINFCINNKKTILNKRTTIPYDMEVL